MDRDRRLTGYLRGQTDQALAPAGFEFTNGWRVSDLRFGQYPSGIANNKLRSRSASCKNKTTTITYGDGYDSTLCSELFFLSSFLTSMTNHCPQISPASVHLSQDAAKQQDLMRASTPQEP